MRISCHDDLRLDQPVMRDKPIGLITIELTTMRGEVRIITRRISVCIPNDREQLPPVPTLNDVIHLVLKRQHPCMQYIAEQNGVRVVSYREEYTLRQLFSRIDYDSTGQAVRIRP